MPGPINPGRRRERLTSIDDPKSIGTYQAQRSPPPPPPPKPPPACPNPECPGANISVDTDGTVVCYGCGTELERSNIVAEITFGENAAGAAVVQGGFVGENQRHANTMGGTIRGLGGMESRQQTEKRGSIEIDALCSALQQNRIAEQAKSWYKLALNHNFVQGRRIRVVAAVAIYLAARKQPQNTLMLMDLSEKVMVNVWVLGNTYKQFCRTIMETDPAQLAGNRAVLEIEPLMLKFCRKLEFNEAAHRVADDACKLLQRMDRDWMVQGRNPAGLCGACIILAARMNNFRRTVREVVYVVKVADTTINQRLYEFKRTQSSTLTVDQFRQLGHRLKVKTLPPAVWRREEKEKRAEERKRKAAEALVTEDEDDAGEGTDEVTRSPSQGVSGKPKKQRTSKGKGKAAPPLADGHGSPQVDSNSEETTIIDVDALEGGDDAGLDALAKASAISVMDVDEEEIIIPKRRGRPPKKREPIVIPQEDLEIEADLEDEIISTVKDWEPTFKLFEQNDNHPVLVQAGDRARQLVEEHMPNGNINTEEEIGEDEFEDDPDVAACVLEPHEVRIKERVWVTVNEDWLREQQAKMLAKALEEAKGKPAKPKRRRKVHQMGDGSVLGGQPAASAAEATQKMLDKRAKHFSSHINYDRLKELFPGTSSPSAHTSTPGGSGQGASPAASARQQQPELAPPLIQVEDADAEVGDEDAEGEEEEEYQEEDEDLEANYAEDYDEGFNDNDNYDDY